jgi:hypothetical protein
LILIFWFLVRRVLRQYVQKPGQRTNLSKEEVVVRKHKEEKRMKRMRAKGIDQQMEDIRQKRIKEGRDKIVEDVNAAPIGGQNDRGENISRPANDPYDKDDPYYRDGNDRPRYDSRDDDYDRDNYDRGRNRNDDLGRDRDDFGRDSRSRDDYGRDSRSRGDYDRDGRPQDSYNDRRRDDLDRSREDPYSESINRDSRLAPSRPSRGRDLDDSSRDRPRSRDDPYSRSREEPNRSRGVELDEED